MDDSDLVRMANSIVWLESQQHAAQGLLTKLQQQIDQLGAFAREHSLGLRGHGEELDRLRSQATRLPGVEEAAHRLQEMMARLHEERGDYTARLERLERSQEADSRRLNQSIVEVRQLVEPLLGEIGALPGKIAPLLEGLRRQQDAVVELHRDVEMQTAEQRSLATRLQGTLDQTRRLEQEALRLAAELEPLRQQDEATLTRVRALGDAIKHIADQSANWTELEQQYHDLLDRSQLQRAEHQSLGGQVVSIGQSVSEHAEQLAEIVRSIKAMEEKLRVDSEALAALADETRERWQRVLDLMEEHNQLLRAQKKREVAELEQQLHELRERAIWREAQ